MNQDDTIKLATNTVFKAPNLYKRTSLYKSFAEAEAAAKENHPRNPIMNREDIIRMAQEAGFHTSMRDYGDKGPMPFVATIGLTCLYEVERLAKAAYAAGVADEREACAQVAYDQAQDEPYGHAKFRCVNIADAIRARETKC